MEQSRAAVRAVMTTAELRTVQAQWVLSPVSETAVWRCGSTSAQPGVRSASTQLSPWPSQLSIHPIQAIDWTHLISSVRAAHTSTAYARGSPLHHVHAVLCTAALPAAAAAAG